MPFAGLSYSVDMFLSLHVGFVVTYNLQKKVVMKGRKILRFYFTSGNAILDILSIIPWVAQVRAAPPLPAVDAMRGRHDSLAVRQLQRCVAEGATVMQGQ